MRTETKATFSFPIMIFIFGAIGYFVYAKTMAGFFAILLIAFVMSLIAILGAIPVLGLIGYWFLGRWAIDKILVFVELESSWLTTFLFWWYGAMAILLTLVFGIVLYFFLSHKGTFKSKKSTVVNYCKSKFSKKDDIQKCIADNKGAI